MVKRCEKHRKTHVPHTKVLSVTGIGASEAPKPRENAQSTCKSAKCHRDWASYVLKQWENAQSKVDCQNPSGVNGFKGFQSYQILEKQ